jgi:dihydropteroate synthase
VAALRDDPALLPLVVQRRVPVVLMHRRGRTADRYEGPAYRDVVEDVRDFLLGRARAAEAAGIARERIAFDPGIGFGKCVEENIALIAGAGRLAAAGYPVLVGSSRKSFIGRLTGITEPRRRDPASVWLAVEAARQGAALLRVHDVAGVRQALAVWAAMR